MHDFIDGVLPAFAILAIALAGVVLWHIRRKD